MLILYLSVILFLFVLAGFLLYLYIKERKLFNFTFIDLEKDKVSYDLKFFCLFDKVRGEMILSPFQAHNIPCCIRQVQEIVSNKSLPLPKDLSELELIHLYSMNAKELTIFQPEAVRICTCDDLSLKKAYERYKETN